jgi:prepilin-type N-terminal cleavage/methylation domain-containing protein
LQPVLVDEDLQIGEPMVACKDQGFTLVEAMVAMVIFTLGFSGLYFFYGISQQVIADSEKRMYINLMGDRIVETIAAEGMRSVSDPLNPFKPF